MRLKIVDDGSTMELKIGPSHVEALTAFLEEHCDPVTPSEFYRQPRAPSNKVDVFDGPVIQPTIAELEEAIAELRSRQAVPSGLTVAEQAEINRSFGDAQRSPGGVVFKP